MASETQELFMALDKKHPDYSAYETDWSKYRDCLGNELVEKGVYLPRNKIEPSDQYAFRLKISEFIPETALAVSSIVAALYKEKPKRDFGPQTQDLDEFVKDVTLGRQGINPFMERVIYQLIGFGSTRILINMRSSPDDFDDEGRERRRTRAEEIEQNIRPYAVIYSPLSVIDWDSDEFGELTMVRIKEIRHQKDDPSNPLSPHQKITRFLHYDRMNVAWWDFAGERGKEKAIDVKKRPHNLGVVPMVVGYWPGRVRAMIGQSYIAGMSKADVQKFRSESDQSYDTYLHAHPFLRVWTEDEMSEVGIGSGSFLKLRPGGAGAEREDVSYVEAPTSAFEALKLMIEMKQETIRRHARTDPLGAIEGGGVAAFQASGAARAWSFGTSEARILSDLADAAVDIERFMYDLVLRWQSRSERALSPRETLFKGDVQYPEEFDLSSTQILIEETGEISSMINSPTLLRLLHKRIASSKIGDASPENIRQIQKEIDENPLINTSVGKSQADLMKMPFTIAQAPEENEDETAREGEEEEDQTGRGAA